MDVFEEIKALEPVTPEWLEEIKAMEQAAPPEPWYADGWAQWDDELQEYREIHDTSPVGHHKIFTPRNMAPKDNARNPVSLF